MSNHLGDTNKMVDTPRTEAEVNRQKCWSDDLVTIDANFACQLERELNAANSKIELLMSANADVARIAGERDAAEKRIKRLEAVTNDPHALWTNWLRGDVKLPVGIGDVRQYQDRIKRLEELGHELRECASRIGTVASGEGSVIRRTEEAIQAWDKEDKQ